MRQVPKIPKILSVNRILGLLVSVVFNNGESRLIDFEKLFNAIPIGKDSPVYKLFTPGSFRRVKVRNGTLSWDNVDLFADFKNRKIKVPFEIGADTLYKMSIPDPDSRPVSVGALIKAERKSAGLTLKELASRSGTTHTYISRLENNKSGIEISTLEKIVRSGLGKKLEIRIGPEDNLRPITGKEKSAIVSTKKHKSRQA